MTVRKKPYVTRYRDDSRQATWLQFSLQIPEDLPILSVTTSLSPVKYTATTSDWDTHWEMAEIHDQFDTILILDFGSQVRFSHFFWHPGAHWVAVQSLDYTKMSWTQRLCRINAMYNKDWGYQFQAERSPLYLFDVSIGLNAFPSGIILSGSPYSVYDNVSPHVDPAVFDLGVPILGICYGLQV